MKALVLFSGGVDSTTCLAMAIETYGKDNVICLSILYGQKHTKELEAAKAIMAYYGVERMTLDLENIFAFSNCSLLVHSNEEIPRKAYSEQLKETKGSPVSTYVPFRNGLFLSAAASIALARDCDYIYYGAHMDDAAGNAYPDCGSEFFDAMNLAIKEGSSGKLKVKAPFIQMNKSEIIALGLKLGAPYQLTWSCYIGEEVPCGKCGTCIDRQKAFENNGVQDPLLQTKFISNQNY